MRAYATANTAHSIPNDNHSDLKRTSSIMISKSYQNSQLLTNRLDTGIRYLSWSILPSLIERHWRTLCRHYRTNPPFEMTVMNLAISNAVFIDFTQGTKVVRLSYMSQEVVYPAWHYFSGSYDTRMCITDPLTRYIWLDVSWHTSRKLYTFAFISGCDHRPCCSSMFR